MFQIMETGKFRLIGCGGYIVLYVVSEETPLVPRQGKKRENENCDEFS